MPSDNSTIQVPAIFTGFSSRSDGGASLRFATNELNDVDFGVLKKLHNSFGYIAFRANEFTDKDIPKGNASDESKSPSQRLRAALFVLWKQIQPKAEFDSFYKYEMEKIINAVKQKLED